MILFDKKPRGKKGEGRSTIFKPINLPTDVAADLKLVKNIYEVACSAEKDQSGYPIPVKLSYGQILSHWMDNLERPGETAQDLSRRPHRRCGLGHAVFLHQ